MVGSPFDYEHAALVYLPTDIVEPNDSYGHQRTMMKRSSAWRLP